MYSMIMRKLVIGISFIFFSFGSSYATNVKDYGAKGDGKTDDTKAIYSAIAGAKDGLLEFPKGVYRITKTILIDLSKNGPMGIMGKGGSAGIVMASEGPAFTITGTHHGSADPSTLATVTRGQERMPLISSLEITGDHEQADGIELRNTIMPVIESVFIHRVKHGIRFTSRNRNIIINDCQIYDVKGVGIFLDAVNIHQMIISNSHISYCKGGGINIIESEIRNLQITGNDIEYNCSDLGAHAADILIDCSKGGSVREGTLSGNTIQAVPSPAGANIRFVGLASNPDKIGLWSITGNHISNQQVNIRLEHCRGLSITGNTFIRGYQRHVAVNNCRNVIVSGNVFDHNEDYFPKDVKAAGGVVIDKSRAIILSDNVLDGSGAENGDRNFAAINIVNSKMVSIRGMHISNSKQHGISIDNSQVVNVTDCIISEEYGRREMAAAIVLSGSCKGSTIKHNALGLGERGTLINQAEGVLVSDNTVLDF